MIILEYKPLYILAVIFTFSATIEATEFGNSRKCPKKAGKFPIPNSFCTSFYTCEGWRVVREESCQGNQHFNPTKGWCVDKEQYPCLEKPSRKECPKSNGRFLKNGTACEIYFDCCNGQPTEKKCPEDQLFDAKSGKCDWEELVECDESPKNKDCPKPNGKFLKPGTKCKIYFECCKGKAKEKMCPKYQLFNTKTGKCDKQERVICKEKENKNCPKPNGRFPKSGTGCKVYFDCYKGRDTEKKCPKNELFDYKAGKCDWEELVTCKDEETSDESSSSSSESTESLEYTRESTPRNRITSPPTSQQTISEELISDLTTRDIQGSSTSEKIESPLPSTYFSTLDPKLSTIDENSNLTKPTTESILEPITMETTAEIPLSSTHFSTRDLEISTIHENITNQTETITESILDPITVETTEDVLSSTHFSTRNPEISTIDGNSSSNPTKTNTESSLEPSTLETVEEFLSSTHLSTADENSSQTEPTTESIMEPVTKETTIEDLPSTRFPTEDPIISTVEVISSSYQTEQSSSGTSKETILEEISTESQSTSSSFVEITQSTTRNTIDEINISQTVSSLATSSEISSPSSYGTTIDPVLVGFVCPEQNGYYPHPNNKRKFIGCVHNIAYIMDCPSNLVYNDKKRQCVYDT